jgi:hypothetical protein
LNSQWTWMSFSGGFIGLAPGCCHRRRGR